MTEAFEGLTVAEGVVLPEWIDVNGHMNVAYYVLAFDLAIDALWARIGITADSIRETRGSTFAVEAHVTYQQELLAGEPYVVAMQLLAYDEKRIHHFQRMYHREKRYLAATAEWLSLHVDLEKRRVSQWPSHTLTALAELARLQHGASAPQEAGRRMGISSPIYELNNRREA